MFALLSLSFSDDAQQKDVFDSTEIESRIDMRRSSIAGTKLSYLCNIT